MDERRSYTLPLLLQRDHRETLGSGRTDSFKDNKGGYREETILDSWMHISISTYLALNRVRVPS